MQLHSKKIEISETLASFRIDVEREYISLIKIKKIISKLEKIPKRDKFELTIDVDGVDETIGDTLPASTKAIEEHYLENKDPGQIKLSLLITKKHFGNKISIYSIDKFLEYFNAKSTTEKIEILDSIFNENIIFEVFSTFEEIESRTIKFIKHNSTTKLNKPGPDPTYRATEIEKLKENTNLININGKFIPSDFDITTNNNKNSTISEFFSKAKLLYSIAYIANSAEITANQEVKFKFNGYRTLTTNPKKPEKLNESTEIAYKIYSWAYSEGPCSDKLGLIRNIVTLDSTDENLNLTTSTWNTIQSNYEIYLKRNIGHYLELKSKLIEYVSDFNKRALESSDGFISSFQNNAIGFTTFIVTVVAINGIKDAGPEKVFSLEYLIISILIGGISALWLIISKSDTQNRIDYLVNTIRNSIEENYSKILSKNEIYETIEPTILKSVSHTNKRINRYKNFWICSTVAFLLLFILGHIFLNKPQNPELPKNKTNLSEPRNVDPARNPDQNKLFSI